MRFFVRVGIILYFISGTLNVSFVYGNTLEGKEDQEKADLAKEYYRYANSYRLSNQFDSAMHFAIKALRIYEEYNDSVAIFESMSQIGYINILNENYDAAEEYFMRASPIAIALKDSQCLAINYHHIGLVHQKKGEFDNVISDYKKALIYAIAVNDKVRIAVLNGNIGSSLMDQGFYEDGLPYIQKALKIKLENNAKAWNICHSLLDLSELHRRMGNYEKALYYSDRVIELADSVGQKRSLQLGYQFKSQAYHKMGEDDLAYKYLLMHIGLKDSIFDKEKANQIQKLQISYESEKKDNEIASLEQAKELEKSRKQLYLILVIAIVLIAAGLHNQQRQKVKRNILLLEKEKEVDRLKSNFFASISHEFRTPLTLILGPIQMKLAKETDPEIREELKMMERNTIRLQRLINDILDIAKSEEGKLSLKEESIDLYDTINGLSASFSSLAESKQLNYVISNQEIMSSSLSIIDKEKLETILINLLSNAFKFTSEGGSIEFSAKSELNKKGEGWLSCSVKDSGTGIPKDKLKRIFDRFYQVDDSSTRKQEGTGIGLAFTQELTSLMGGEIVAESEVGVGTIFKVALPFKIANEKEVTKNVGNRVKGRSLHLTEALLSVDNDVIDTEIENDLPILLLVEDNKDLSSYIQSLLVNEYQVRIAENGRDGLDLALSIIPDLIISDIMMPVMDGYEMCNLIKTNIATSHIPVMLLSAKNSTESRIAGLETEADVYMSKPFNPLELQLQVRNIAKQHQKVKDKYSQSDELMPDEGSSNSMEQQFLQKLAKLMEEKHRDPDYSVELLSLDIGLSRSQLHRKLSALTNESASKFIRSYRLKKALNLLKAKSGSISEIAYDVGFNSASYFNKCFLEHFGQRPSEV